MAIGVECGTLTTQDNYDIKAFQNIFIALRLPLVLSLSLSCSFTDNANDNFYDGTLTRFVAFVVVFVVDITLRAHSLIFEM